MIENSRNINSGSFQTHAHEHKVTQCLHEETAGAKAGGGAAAAGMVTQIEQELQKKETFSLTNFVANGFRSFASKAIGFWNDAGKEEGKNPAKEAGTQQAETVLNAVSSEQDGSRQAVEPAAARDVLATAVVKSDNRKTEEITADEEETRKVETIEAAVSGGLEREQGGIKRFLHKFGEVIAKGAGKLLKRESADEKKLAANNTDFSVESNSYLLDSYSKTGQYSTLAKDHSLEGNFKAKG